jgi:geranylgeranyl diphosphate synthase type I
MPHRDAIESRLEDSAVKVDGFIDDLLRGEGPEVLYDAARHLIKAGGKRLRPYLALRSCELVGGDERDAIPFSAAVEVLHNFTLVHDDIMDNDDLRRGVPTVHAKWGLPVAIAAGDLLFAKVYEALMDAAEVPCDRIKDCVKRVTDATIAICEGQVLDVSFPGMSDVSEEDYLTMIGKKTAALFKASAEVGAIAGGGSESDVERLGSYAWNAGITFQMVDDYLGVTADEKTLGKPVGSDLREGKKTLIVIHALSHASVKERKEIERVLANTSADKKSIEGVQRMLADLGSLDYALERARNYATEATTLLKGFPDSRARRDLIELVDYFMKRTH